MIDVLGDLAAVPSGIDWPAEAAKLVRSRGSNLQSSNRDDMAALTEALQAAYNRGKSKDGANPSKIVAVSDEPGCSIWETEC